METNLFITLGIAAIAGIAFLIFFKVQDKYAAQPGTRLCENPLFWSFSFYKLLILKGLIFRN